MLNIERKFNIIDLLAR